MKVGGPKERIRNWLWWKLAERIPGGTYNHPWLSRVLFCFPCQPEQDQCGIPDHDFCVRCGRPMPNQAMRWRQG